MPKKPKEHRPPPGRYTDAAVAAEIKAAIKRKNERGTHTRLAERMGMDSHQLTHRLGNEYEITIEMAGIAAEFFDAPIGWPFVPWAIGEQLTVKR